MGLLPTAVVGSYPQPDWLIDHAALGTRVPRVRRTDLWRLEGRLLEQAQDDATELAVRAMERAGIDIVTDGEVRRESYSNHFVGVLDGLDFERPGTVSGRSGQEVRVPRVVGPIRRKRSADARHVAFLRSLTDRLVKATVPGPFTMAQQAQDDYYGDSRELALALADAVREELQDLLAAGADVVQLDEPWLQARPEQARGYAIEAIDRALDGIAGETALHICHGYAAAVQQKADNYSFLAELEDCAVRQVSLESAQPKLDLSILRQMPSKTIILGVLDLNNPAVEPVDTIVERIDAALAHVEPERLILAPDCGMKYLPRSVADGKLGAMVAAARVVRSRFGAC
jgi:5-methyltetrahydropteroyltriglutamate--homocysteine methyltransferase